MLLEAQVSQMAITLTYPELMAKRVLVTGAADPARDAWGGAIARAFAGHGGRLILELGGEPAHRSALAEDVRAKARGVRVLSADFSDTAGIDRFADAALKAYDGVDVLINVMRLPESASRARSEKALHAAIASAFRVAQTLTDRATQKMRLTRTKGVVINALVEPKAPHGANGARALALHAMAKTALEAMTQAQARAGYDAGLRVYGLIQTVAAGARAWPDLGSELSDDGDGPGLDDFFHGEAASGDLLDSVEDTALYLASDKGRWMNGAVLSVK